MSTVARSTIVNWSEVGLVAANSNLALCGSVCEGCGEPFIVGHEVIWGWAGDGGHPFHPEHRPR